MPSNELLIRINADAKNALKAFDDAKKKTEELGEVTSRVSLIAAAAFAALSAEIFLSVSAFSEAQAASNSLSQALQNQGIFTTELKEEYKELAEAVSRKTGIDDDQLVAAQAIAQGYLGQTRITEDLTQAIADLGTKYGSVETAAAILGKTIGTRTNALAREGLVLSDNLTQQEKQARVLEFVAAKYGDQAAAADKASFGMNGLKVAVGDLQEALGERFAPSVKAVADALKSLAQAAKDNRGLLDFVAALIAGGAAAAAIIGSVSALAGSFLLIKAAVAAAGLTITVSLGTFALIAAAIVAVGAVAFDLAMNWERRWAFIRAVSAGAAAAIGEYFSALGGVISAAFSGSGTQVNEAMERLRKAAQVSIAFNKAYEESMSASRKRMEEEAKASEEKQSAAKKAEADKQAAEKKRVEALELAANRASNQLQLMQLRQASAEAIKIKQEEASIRKNLITEENGAVILASQERLRQLRALEDAQHAEDLERIRLFEADKQAVLQELQAAGMDPGTNPLIQQKLDAVRAEEQTEADIRAQFAEERLRKKIASDNEYLKNQQQFGKAYAEVQRVLGSQEVKAAEGLSGEMIGLANSKNATLKAIGKAAALTQIAIATATSAAKVFADSVILFGPIAGPPLGAALAAARIAYGAEQAANVTAAAVGGLVGDGQTKGGGDRFPYMLEAGELVGPRRNFDEIVSGVQTERSGIIDEIRSKLDALTGGVTLQVNVQGDFLGDETVAQKMGRAISDEIEFRNLRFVGVNA